MLACVYESPLGPVLLGQEGACLVGLWFLGQRFFPEAAELEYGDSPVLQRTGKWLDAYFAGQRPEASALPLAPKGTGFRQEVWKLLLEIPYGSTVSYEGLARQLALRRGIPRMSAQAVGGAVGHNPISIIIPCHRVVGKDGSLVGYAGGLERKAALLAHENAGETGESGGYAYRPM